MASRNINQLRKAGYTVDASKDATGSHSAILFVQGYGLQTYVNESDQAAVQALLDNPVQALANGTVEDLRGTAASLKIDGRSDMTKGQLIDAIVSAQASGSG